MRNKKRHIEHIESIKPGILMLLDETHPIVIVSEPFEKNWFVAQTIEIRYHWVEILYNDAVQIVELERLTHMED